MKEEEGGQAETKDMFILLFGAGAFDDVFGEISFAEMADMEEGMMEEEEESEAAEEQRMEKMLKREKEKIERLVRVLGDKIALYVDGKVNGMEW